MSSRKDKPAGGEARLSLRDLTGGLPWLAFVGVALLAAVAAALLFGGGPKGFASPSEPPAETESQAPEPTPMPVTPPPCVAPPDWLVHTVQQGNTLYSLAERYGTDIETLKRVNCLEGDIIYVGQDLYVPGPPRVEQPAVGDEPVTFSERYVNIALLGSDKRPNSTTWRTDTMIVASIDTQDGIVRLLSIPRDLWVNIPGHGFDRINTADLWGELRQEGGGPELVKETIYQNLGIPIHYYVRVDFDGFQRIIDALDGVDVDVECPLTDIDLEPGVQHMDGELALLYARSRITTSDFDRGRRQRKLLMALWEKAAQLNIVTKLPALWVAMADTVQTDLSLNEVLALARFGTKLRPSQIFTQSIGPWQVENYTTPEGYAVLLPIPEEIQALLDSFFAPPDMEFVAQINETTVAVLDGSPYPDAGLLAAKELGWAGFQVVETRLAEAQGPLESAVIVYDAPEAVAELAAQTLDLPRAAIRYESDPNSAADIQVVLGWNYDPCEAQ